MLCCADRQSRLGVRYDADDRRIAEGEQRDEVVEGADTELGRGRLTRPLASRPNAGEFDSSSCRDAGEAGHMSHAGPRPGTQ